MDYDTNDSDYINTPYQPIFSQFYQPVTPLDGGFNGYSSRNNQYFSYYQMAVNSTDKYADLSECVKNEDFDTLRKVFEDFGEVAASPNLTTIAAEINRFDILTFLIENGCCWSPDVLLNATKHNNTEMIEYCLRTPGYDKQAFIEGSRIMLNSCPWHPDCVNYLAKFNQLRYLELMYTIYYPDLERVGNPFWSNQPLKDCDSIQFLEFYLKNNSGWSCNDVLEFIFTDNFEAVQLCYKYYQQYVIDHPEYQEGINEDISIYSNFNQLLSGRKWNCFLVQQAICYNQFDIVRFLMDTGLHMTDQAIRHLNNNSYQISKLCTNNLSKWYINEMKYKPESSADWWTNLIISITSEKIISLGLYSLCALYEDIETDIQTKYVMKEYKDVFPKDIIQYCIAEYF